MLEVRHDSRSGSTMSAMSTMTIVATKTRSGANACQSNFGVEMTWVATASSMSVAGDLGGELRVDR